MKRFNFNQFVATLNLKILGIKLQALNINRFAKNSDDYISKAFEIENELTAYY